MGRFEDNLKNATSSESRAALVNETLYSRLDGVDEINKKIIVDYLNLRRSQRITTNRILRILHSLKHLSIFTKNRIDKLTADDIKAFTFWLENTNYSEATKQSDIQAIKKYLRDINDGDVPKPFREFLKCDSKKMKKLTSTDVLTESEVNQLLAVIVNPKWKCFFHMMWEMGARLGEMVNLKVKDITFDEYGAIVNLFGKTGQRYNRLIESVGTLNYWLSCHPFKDKDDFSEHYLFPKKYRRKEPGHFVNEPVGYETPNSQLHVFAKRASIKKRIYNHLLRHSRATFLNTRLNSQQMRLQFGWSSDKMVGHYSHLNYKEVEKSLFQIYNIEKKEETQTKLKRCRFCQAIIQDDQPYCWQCKRPLNDKEWEKVQAVEEAGTKLLTKEEAKRILIDAAKEILRENPKLAAVLAQQDS